MIITISQIEGVPLDVVDQPVDFQIRRGIEGDGNGDTNPVVCHGVWRSSIEDGRSSDLGDPISLGGDSVGVPSSVATATRPLQAMPPSQDSGEVSRVGDVAQTDSCCAPSTARGHISSSLMQQLRFFRSGSGS
jgi:hypothetical protein